MSELTRYKIHLIYSADGMVRPLSFRQNVPAKTVEEAMRLAENFIKSAYASGYRTHSWSAENLDRPVGVSYIYDGEPAKGPGES